jgi:large subunit ribosomal protein L24
MAAFMKSGPEQRVKMRIRKGDTVQVITGKDKGKTGEVLRTIPGENRVVVQGLNLRTRHVKPTQEGESGRIVTEEASIHASNVMVYSPAKKVASRVEIAVQSDGSKKRRLKKTGELLD